MQPRGAAAATILPPGDDDKMSARLTLSAADPDADGAGVADPNVSPTVSVRLDAYDVLHQDIRYEERYVPLVHHVVNHASFSEKTCANL